MQNAPVRKIFILLILLFSGIALAKAADPTTPRYRAETTKPMQDVIQDLEFAIGTNNFRLTSRNAIGRAIADREQITFPEARVVHFCNLEFARTLLEISSDYLLHMPCRVVVWSEPGRTFVEVWLVPEGLHPRADPLVKKINRILVGIVDTAAEPWNRRDRVKSGSNE